VIALIGVEDRLLKSEEFPRLMSWAKHYREIGSNRKRRYLERFPQRYAKLLSYISLSRVYLSYIDLNRDLRLLEGLVALMLVDDKLANSVVVPSGATVVTESRIRYKYHRQLMALADNLANYFRILLNSSLEERFREELKRFKK